MSSRTNSTLALSIALAFVVAAACSEAPADGTEELAGSLEGSSTTTIDDQSSETDSTQVSSPTTSAQPSETVPTSADADDLPPVLDGLVVADAIETGGGSAELAPADGGFLMVASDANATSVRRSADGREWSTIESDLSLWFNGPMASDGDRVVVYGWREGAEDPTLWASDDGGHRWMSLPAFPKSESDATYVMRPTGVGELAVRGDRIVTVVSEPGEIDWQAYSVEQLGEDHGPVTATWPGFGNELTVSFEDGFELTLDTTALGLPPEGQSPDVPVTAYSYDGASWTRTELPWPMADSSDVVSGPAGFAAIVGQPEAQLIVSDDGIRWTAQPVPARLGRPLSLAGSPFGYVIAGPTTVMFSDDGSTWEVAYESDDVDAALSGPKVAAGGPAGFLLVDVPFTSTSPARATWSVDGRSWDVIDLDLPPMDQGGSVAAVVGDSTALLVPLTMAPDPSSAPPGGPPPGVIPSGPCADGGYPALGAFGLADGTLEWSLCSDEQVYRTVIGVSEELVVVEEAAAFPDVRVVAYDISGGGERWRIPMVHGGVHESATLDHVLVLQVADGDASSAIGVELATGEQLWESEPGVSLVAQTSDVAVLARSGAVEDQVVSGGLIGVDPTSGVPRWTNDVIHQPRGNRTGGAISGRVLALPTFSVDVPPPGDAFTAVDLDTGALVWTAPPLPNAVGANDVFVGIGDRGDIRVVDRSDGTTLWTGRAAAPYGGLLAVGDGALVITDQSQDGEDLVAFELATGAERWRAPTRHLQPQLVSEATAVALWEAELVAVSTVDGSISWSATSPLGTPYMNNAVADDSTVYVAVNSLPWND